ncbi:MAG: cytidine deaminase [Planctomycetota bacterium]
MTSPQPIASGAEAALVAAALDARDQAYAPHSGFRVGAALLTEDGEIVQGCNVENASYGLTICAERVAATRAIAEGRGAFVAIAVIADGPTPVPPCGACRQFLYEFAPDLVVISATLDGAVTRASLRALLPGAFDAGFLERARDERDTE